GAAMDRPCPSAARPESSPPHDRPGHVLLAELYKLVPVLEQVVERREPGIPPPQGRALGVHDPIGECRDEFVPRIDGLLLPPPRPGKRRMVLRGLPAFGST